VKAVLPAGPRCSTRPMELNADVRQDAWIGAAIGGAAAISIGGLLGAAREHVGPTNGALALAIVVVVAATLGGRTAGLVTAVVATASFNFFLVPPYMTLRVDKGQDLAAVCMLGLVGLIVGVGAEKQGVIKARVAEDISAIEAMSKMTELVTDGVAPDQLWDELQRGLHTVVGATKAVFVASPVTGDAASLPLLDSHGSVSRATDRSAVRGKIHHVLFTRRGLSLPVEGVAVAVERAGREVGRVLITTDATFGSTREHRAAAVAIVRLWGMSFSSRTADSHAIETGENPPMACHTRTA
jgi:K+-sensing histidine kinase KdpD